MQRAVQSPWHCKQPGGGPDSTVQHRLCRRPTDSRDPLPQPCRLKHLTLRNRILSTAHESAYPEDGLPKERYRLYHAEKDKGGIALTQSTPLTTQRGHWSAPKPQRTSDFNGKAACPRVAGLRARRCRLKAFIADTLALVLFFTVLGALNEHYVAGMT